MKILWFTNVPLPAVQDRANLACKNFGGSWMTGLLDQLVLEEGIALGVATAFPGLKNTSFIENGIQYFVISQPNRYHAFSHRKKDLDKCLSIANLFQPDIIHVHGSERFFGLLNVEKSIKIPVLLSIQGILGECAKFHNNFGALNIFNILQATRILEALVGFGLLWDYRRIIKASRREKKIIGNVNAFAGRTEWDRAFVELQQSKGFYRYVGEILRPAFHKIKWSLDHCHRHTIIFTNAGHPRRGTEDLLEAIAFLKTEFPDIRLRLAGTVSHRSGYGRFLRRKVEKLGITDRVDFLGYLNEEQMSQELVQAHVFAITSYIENSPNSLAEAMLVGMPCIASYVGGMPSMVENSNTGLLFPAGDIPLLTNCIRNVFLDDNLAEKLGKNAHRVASERHDPKIVVKHLLSAYHEILSSIREK